jgi:hypothetical protein
MSLKKIPVLVEVSVRPSSQTAESIRQYILAFLHEDVAVFRVGQVEIPRENALSSYCETVEISQCGSSKSRAESVSLWQADLQVSVFSLSDEAPEADFLESPDGDEECSPCTQWTLPRRDFHGLWSSLILEPNVKERLIE